MSSLPPQPSTDDLAAAIREGRPLRPNASYRVMIGDEQLNFVPAVFDDPVPLGRQFISAIGGKPVEEFAAVAVLANGDFEDIRLDEGYDLRGRGAEKVLVFRTDRSFKFKIDQRNLEWPRASISGFVLRKLAELPTNYSLWLEVRGGHDRKILDTDLIRLDEPGVERFITLIDQTTEGREALPSMDRAYLESHAYAFEVVADGSEIGVILKGFPLPTGKFNQDVADVLILLPSGYPDCAPDMFYVSPQLVIKASGHLPRKADVSHKFGGRTWQRWSRHNPQWRAGIDGLQTMIARVRAALDGARS